MKTYKFIDEIVKGRKSHYHTFDGKPLLGSSSVVGILNKPLTWWASGLACQTLGWTNSKLRVDGKYTTIPLEQRIKAVEPSLAMIKTMNEESFLELMDRAYRAHSEKLDSAADKGVDTHQLCEDYIKGKDGDYKPIKAFTDWAEKNVEKFLWSEAHCYSETLCLGGIIDAGYISKDGKVGIIDFKSAKEAYSSHFYQIALYDIQVTENGWVDRDGKQLGKLEKPIDHYVVFPFGMTKCEAQYRFNVDEIKEGAKACVLLYKQNNK